MKTLQAFCATALLVCTAAAATGIPAPDFSIWARKTLKDDGITGHVVETNYPYSFTFCQEGSNTLWRRDVMSVEHLEAVRQGKIVKAVEKMVALEESSQSCKYDTVGRD